MAGVTISARMEDSRAADALARHLMASNFIAAVSETHLVTVMTAPDFAVEAAQRFAEFLVGR